MSEGPLHKSITFSFHDGHKEGQVSVLATAISIHSQSQTCLVDLPASVEESRVQGNSLAYLGLVSATLNLLYLPDEATITTCNL